ncbi:5277_t:CDS:2, partial [Cetraspora pellucida]
VHDTRLKKRESQENLIIKVPIISDTKRGTLAVTFISDSEDTTSIDWAEVLEYKENNSIAFRKEGSENIDKRSGAEILPDLQVDSCDINTQSDTLVKDKTNPS